MLPWSNGTAQASAPLALTAATPSATPVTEPQRKVPIGGPFKLLASGGRTVTDEDFRGRYMLVFFGFTFCPDICPTKLDEIARTLQALGEDAKQVAPLFISVDPERDTPETIGDYVASFDTRITGLTGTPDDIFNVAKAYKAYYQKVALDDQGTYTMDHSALTYLMGRDGTFRKLFRPDETPEQVAEIIRQVMAEDKGS
ncbi:MAG: SCO family protein [Alphaproteobacteria bacterium]|nr:SCO family protein [Alphaproteobacteria bacterium]